MPSWGAAIVYAGLLLGALERAEAADASVPFWLPLQVATASDPQAAAAAGPIYQQYLPAGRGFDWTRAGYQEGKLPIPYPTANILNVKFKRFGAKGDGKADDSAALQRAFDEANRSPNGAVVYLPAGTYRLRRPLTITNSKVVLRGDGERRTTILIPISLGDYFKGSWTQTPGGKIVSQWSAGGAFITFEGKRQRSNNDRTRLARIRSTKVVPRYSRTIPVSSTTEFKLGQRIRIFLNDKSTVSRRRLLADNATDAAAGVAATAGGVRLQRRRPPAWVLAHPAYRSAQRKLASLVEPGEGLSPAAAAAADADFARRYGAEGGVQSAAAPGTLVAWLYGGNLVDSGPNTGVIDTDEIQCRAVVAGIGRGTVTLDRPLCFSIDPRWQTSIHEDVPTLQQGGVEKLTIRFKHTLNMPHHGDKGFNALEVNFAANFWIRNVTILNADNGIFFSWGDRSTMLDVKAGVTAPRVNPRWPDSRNGHHPFTIEESRDCVLRRFELRNTFIHDVTVTSGSSLNVIMEGRGVDLNLDHHRTAPWGNLFTDLNLGLGTRPFKSGGNKARGAYSGLLNTYYNLRKADGSAVELPDCNFGPLLNFRGKLSGNKCASSKWFVAPLPKGGPPNLYWAQRKARVAAEQAAAKARGRG